MISICAFVNVLTIVTGSVVANVATAFKAAVGVGTRGTDQIGAAWVCMCSVVAVMNVAGAFVDVGADDARAFVANVAVTFETTDCVSTRGLDKS